MQALGRLEWQLGAFPNAIGFYSRALAIKEAHYGPEHPDLGTTLYGQPGRYPHVVEDPEAP